MSTKALLLEILISGFFAIACLRARAAAASPQVAMRPLDLLKLKSRLERLSRTRWQWVSMVAILVVVRLQAGVPLTVELTAAALFLLFLALPAEHTSPALARPRTR